DIRNHRLRLGLRLELRLRPVFAIVVVFARLMLLARLVGLPLALMITLLILARHIGLRLRRDEAGLLPEIGKTLAVVVAILGGHFAVDARLLLRLALAELLLGRGDQAEVMLGVLVVILGGDRIAGRAGVTRQLHIFLGDVGGGAADLDVGPV